jgi:endonuclease/exonuclease/phosphatase family metal-dependent hydrolase
MVRSPTPNQDAALRAVTWNLFHGRDRPPEPRGGTCRSRLVGTTERGERFVQAGGDLFPQFAAVLARDPWHLVLLQEAPPRWFRRLCAALGAHGANALTSRNAGAWLRARVADRRPDLIGSWEGGSNQVLVRPPWRIVEARRLTLTLIPERRRMLFCVIEGPAKRRMAVANLHTTFLHPGPARREVRLAAACATRWAASLPLLFGGDLNLRPRTSAATFALLDRRFGLEGPTSESAIDHLLVRGVQRVDGPTRLPAAWRELPSEHPPLLLRLSDHDAVAAELSP